MSGDGENSSFKIPAEEFGRLIEQVRQMVKQMERFENTLAQMNSHFATQRDMDKLEKRVDEMERDAIKPLQSKFGLLSIFEKVFMALAVAAALAWAGFKS